MVPVAAPSRAVRARQESVRDHHRPQDVRLDTLLVRRWRRDLELRGQPGVAAGQHVGRVATGAEGAARRVLRATRAGAGAVAEPADSLPPSAIPALPAATRALGR